MSDKVGEDFWKLSPAWKWQGHWKMPKNDICRILEINQSLSSIQGVRIQAKQQASQHLQLPCSHTPTLGLLIALKVRNQRNRLYDACVYTCI